MEFIDNQGNYKQNEIQTYKCEKHKIVYYTLCTMCGVEQLNMLTAPVYGDWPEEAMEMEADYSWDDTHHFINALSIKEK